MEVNMSGFKITALCCAVGVLTLAGCGGGGGTTAKINTATGNMTTTTTAQRTLSESDAGSTVMVSKGGTVQIVLAGNPTTGYQWQLTAGDASIIRQVGEATFQPDTDAIGAGGKEILRFEADSPGTTILKLEYRRPWENVPPENTYEVIVQVS